MLRISTTCCRKKKKQKKKKKKKRKGAWNQLIRRGGVRCPAKCLDSTYACPTFPHRPRVCSSVENSPCPPSRGFRSKKIARVSRLPTPLQPFIKLMRSRPCFYYYCAMWALPDAYLKPGGVRQSYQPVKQLGTSKASKRPTTRDHTLCLDCYNQGRP